MMTPELAKTILEAFLEDNALVRGLDWFPSDLTIGELRDFAESMHILATIKIEPNPYHVKASPAPDDEASPAPDDGLERALSPTRAKNARAVLKALEKVSPQQTGALTLALGWAYTRVLTGLKDLEQLKKVRHSGGGNRRTWALR